MAPTISVGPDCVTREWCVVLHKCIPRLSEGASVIALGQLTPGAKQLHLTVPGRQGTCMCAAR